MVYSFWLLNNVALGLVVAIFDVYRILSLIYVRFIIDRFGNSSGGGLTNFVYQVFWCDSFPSLPVGIDYFLNRVVAFGQRWCECGGFY